MTAPIGDAASFRVFLYRNLKMPWRCRPRRSRNEGFIDHRTKGKPLDGTAEKPSREFGKLPTCAPCCHHGPGSAGTALPRSAAGRIKRHKQSTMPICGLQPSSAVVSAVALWGRGQYLRTAFVLTWFKIKERQVSVYELLRTLKLLCRKGFTVL